MPKFCPGCGLQLTSENVKFCPECGESFSNYQDQSKVKKDKKKRFGILGLIIGLFSIFIGIFNNIIYQSLPYDGNFGTRAYSCPDGFIMRECRGKCIKQRGL